MQSRRWLIGSPEVSTRTLRLVAAATTLVVASLLLTPVPAKSAAGGDHLAAGQWLYSGQAIRSSAGSLVMQGDGNLVEYDVIGKVIWASNTAGRAGAVVTMQGDGNLVIIAPGNVPIWASGTSGRPGANLVIQRDGNLVIYHNGAPVWATNRFVYNRNEATTYQETYCGAGSCPQSYNSSYVYFSSSNDCANFVSQSLRAGFKRMVGTPHNDWTNASYWWNLTTVEYYVYYGMRRYSQSASVAQKLFHFLTWYSGYGSRVGDYWLGPAPTPAPSTPGGMHHGDVYFYDWDNNGTIDHSNMQVGTGTSTYKGWYGHYVNSHTTNRYHVQWTLTEVNPNWQTTTAFAVHINN